MSEKGWVGWVVQNKAVAGGVAASLVLVASGLVVVASRSGKDDKSASKVAATETTVAGETTTSAGGDTSTTAAGQTASSSGATATRPRTVTTRRGAITLPTNLGIGAPNCTPQSGFKTKGLDDKSVHVGELYTDSNILPQQFKPANQGLRAAIGLINDNGGVCGRQLVLDARADNGLQTTGPGSYVDNWNTLKGSVFAFVGTNSLRDGDTYQNDTPFDQNSKDGNEEIPDIGGLALSYNRSQSPWYAGNVGSISPSLVGGGAFKAMVEEAASGGGTGKGPCKGAAFLYLTEPTGASEDSAREGGIAMAADWGGNLKNVHYYQQQLAATVQQYQATVQQMVSNGDNCVFTYADLQSNINLVEAMQSQGVWPPSSCTVNCFSVTYIPFAGYDPQFYKQAGAAANGVTTFIPHVPLNETGDSAMKTYLSSLSKYVSGNDGPGSFSIIGYTAGLMFAKLLGDCGAAPTRTCVMNGAKNLQNYDAGGMLGPITPFKSTRVSCASGCGNPSGTGFAGRGTYNFKWIFTCSAYLRVSVKNGKQDFYRYSPGSGYNCDTLHVARGTAA